NTITITISSENCTSINGQSPGFQAGILSACPTPGGNANVVPGACFASCGQTDATFTITSTLFVVGQQYWFLVDGCSGSVCEYEVLTTNGIQPPSLDGQSPSNSDLTGPSVVCPNENVTINLTSPIFATEFVWNT